MRKIVFVQITKEDGFKEAFTYIDSAEVDTLIEVLEEPVETAVNDGIRIFIHTKPKQE